MFLHSNLRYEHVVRKAPAVYWLISIYSGQRLLTYNLLESTYFSLCLHEIAAWVWALGWHPVPSLHTSSLPPACQKMSVLILIAVLLAQVTFAAHLGLPQTSAVLCCCAGRIKALVFIPVLSCCLGFCVICLVLVAPCAADLTPFPCLLNPGRTHADPAVGHCL